MKNIILESTSSTPKVSLDGENGKALFEGACYPENSFAFFEPILAWFEDYPKTIKKPLTVTFKLDYFNTSTSKSLLDLFDILNHFKDHQCEVNVEWIYCEDDEDILESGEEFAEDLDLEFNFIAE